MKNSASPQKDIMTAKFSGLSALKNLITPQKQSAPHSRRASNVDAGSNSATINVNVPNAAVNDDLHE